MLVVNSLENLHIIYRNVDEVVEFVDKKITAFITIKQNIHHITKDL